MIADARQRLLDGARVGDNQALGELLDSYRSYLAMISGARGASRMKGKLGQSDLIQETLLEAHRGFTSFRGTSVKEFAGWLRQIVVRATAHALRDQFDVAKRNADRERTVEGLSSVIVFAGTTPLARIMRRETEARIGEVITRLPKDMQAVIVGRHVDNLSYAELAERLGRTEGALRLVYSRAVRRLRDECGQ